MGDTPEPVPRPRNARTAAAATIAAMKIDDAAPAVTEGGPAGDAQRMRLAFPAVIAALTCIHATMAATRVAGTLWLLKAGYAEWTVGALLSLYALPAIGLSLWSGRMADRHGMHRPLAIAAVMGFLGPLASVAALGIASIVVAAVMTGGAVTIAAVAIQHEAGQMARDTADLKRVFGWAALAPALSNAIAPVVVGLLIDHVGYRAAFVFALVLPLAAWACGRWVPRRHLGPRRAEPERRPAFDLLRHAPLRRLLVVNLALSACWDAHSFAVPVLGHARHLSASVIGTLLGSFAVAATGVRFAISSFSHRIDEQRALKLAMTTAAAASAVYVFLPGVAGMLAGSFVLGLALGSVQPMLMALLHQVTPPARRGQALGLRSFWTNAATLAMPAGFGLLAAATVPAAPMWLMASLVALALVPARRIDTGRAAA
jgi:MFS family permease